MSNNDILNLDEILGKKELAVTWNGQSYELKMPNDLNPEEYMELLKMGEKFVGYADVKNASGISEDILHLVGRMLELVSPELAKKNLPFSGQLAVLTFWKEQQAGPVKKKLARASK